MLSVTVRGGGTARTKKLDLQAYSLKNVCLTLKGVPFGYFLATLSQGAGYSNFEK